MNKRGGLCLMSSASLSSALVSALVLGGCSSQGLSPQPMGGQGGAAGSSVSSSTGGNDGSTGSPPPVYHLVQRRSVAAPLGQPTGVAYDGQALWVMIGGFSPPTAASTLIHFDPVSLITDKTFEFDNLAETPGTGVYGITWDGQAVWISVSGNTSKLVRVDPNTGAVTHAMSSPASLGPSDLDFDGTDLLLSTGTGEVFTLDATSGGVIRKFEPAPASSGRDNGVAFHPGEIWVGELFGGMEVHDPVTGALIATAVHEDGTAFTQEEMGGSCFVGDQLVIASQLGLTYFDVQRP